MTYDNLYPDYRTYVPKWYEFKVELYGDSRSPLLYQVEGSGFFDALRRVMDAHVILCPTGSVTGVYFRDLDNVPDEFVQATYDTYRKK